ncbi:MAG TPA: cyclodeaminase/cyclohydrolase family protein [Gaiellaceae bacterium]|jgi:formiminotetrahydrofolate cyclodeaminase|nr:cyclodeaminase/cyclohydrolase family protein [Gaiellaceae bacterium]
MASPRSFLDLTVAELLDEFAAPRPPGGGSALGLTVAIAASVVAMAARASTESWAAAGGVAAQAEALRARATPLAQRDAETYDEALAVRDGVAALPLEKRDWEIGQAFAAAAEAPLEIARAATDVAELAADVAVWGDPRVRADAVAAATLAAAAARGAVTLVAVNLTAVADDPRVVEAEWLAVTAADAASRAVRAV